MSREIDVLVARIIFGMTDFEVNLDGYMIKNYSTDIAAAWEIVEKIELINSQTFAIERHKDGKYEVTIGSKFVYATSAPMAICLAALKAVGHES